MDIWQACKDRFSHQTLGGQLVRVVESQEQVATNYLVETLDEQYMLEKMLERNKPHPTAEANSFTNKQAKNKHVKNSQQALHYLLATPFRYPPLKYGSRFGKKTAPSLLYASKHVSTALAESAYYRFVFWRGMQTPPSSNKFITQHTVWGANYYTNKGASLHAPPFNDYSQQLAAPDSYQYSQALGEELRVAGIQAFEFTSARDADQGLNVALFTPQPLANKQPSYQQQWLCDTNNDEVVFYSASDKAIYNFSIDQFLVNKKFVMPAVS